MIEDAAAPHLRHSPNLGLGHGELVAALGLQSQPAESAMAIMPPDTSVSERGSDADVAINAGPVEEGSGMGTQVLT